MDAVIYALADQAIQKAKGEYNEWQQLTVTMPEARYGHAAAPISGDRILFFGGADSTGTVKRTPYLYDHATQTFTTRADDPYSRFLGMAAPLSQDRVLVVGGKSSTSVSQNAMATVRIYDAKTNTWSTAASMTSSRFAAFCAPLSGDRVLVAGGCYKESEGTFHRTSELYDLGSNTWTAVADMYFPGRAWGAAAPLSGDRMIAIGGSNSSDHGANGLSYCEIYSLSTNTWTSAAPLESSESRLAFAAAPLSGDRVLVTGGAHGGHLSEEKLARGDTIYVASENRWYMRNRIPFHTSYGYALKWPAAAPISGDRIVVCGGMTTTGYTTGYSNKVYLYTDKNPALITLLEAVKAIAAIR